jgi:PhnB protein
VDIAQFYRGAKDEYLITVMASADDQGAAQDLVADRCRRVRRCCSVSLVPQVRSSLIERMHVMSVELNAYLFFPGNAEQAIAFYQQVFGGQVSITRLGDVDPTATAEQKNLVLNALLAGGDITLRASDREDTSVDPQTRIELSLIGTDEERLRALFDGLANGGTVRTELAKQFWGDIYGAVTDKYGIGWQVNIGAAGA